MKHQRRCLVKRETLDPQSVCSFLTTMSWSGSGYGLLAEEGFDVVGDTDSAQEATELILALRPDVAILNGRLPDGTGVEVCRNVRSHTSAVQCLILTSYDDDQARSAAVLAGAAGYVVKEIHSTDLVDKIRRATAQETLFDPVVKARIVKNLADPRLRDPRSAPLTDQERKVLSLIGEGLTNREISDADVPGREDDHDLRVVDVGEDGIPVSDSGGGLRRHGRGRTATLKRGDWRGPHETGSLAWDARHGHTSAAGFCPMFEVVQTAALDWP